MLKTEIKIAIIGLGYVGLPLAVHFGQKYSTTGMDLNHKRVQELQSGFDRTKETTTEDLSAATELIFTANPDDVKHCNVFIITVPTPIDKHKKPDLSPLVAASKTIGKVLKQDDIVIYESTVYPGCTEEVCVPLLEQFSGLKFNVGFFCGYSPERINPGDRDHTVTKIRKVTSGSTPEIAQLIDDLYKSIISAGTYKASSIRVAEAAKVIENTQRDLNIAFVNELALMFDKIGIDTREVLAAAATKWNFLPFQPGLVGGHCIGVDPYYLTHKAQEVGYHPEIILSGRRLNDNMGAYVAEQTVKGMIQKGHTILNAKVLVLGITFKENCPDIRNSKVIDVIREIRDFGCKVHVYDPWADREEVEQEYGVDLIQNPEPGEYMSVVLAVSHNEFHSLNIQSLLAENGFLYDVKGFLPRELVDKRL